MENNSSLHDYKQKYPFLDIVYIMDGDEKVHYIAKQDVPRNTKITDTRYWQPVDITGNDPDYSNIRNKPTINGVEVDGEMTSEDLGVYSKPDNGIPESDLAPEIQTQLNKHFKGWYDSSSNLPANPVVGDYAYVKGAISSDPAIIYECTTAGTWSDSGRTVDTSSVQTFATGEEVNNVAIDDTQLVNPADCALPAAADVMQLKAKLEGVTKSEVKATYIAIDGYKIQGTGNIASNTNSKYTTIALNNAEYVRFLGLNLSSETSTTAKNTGYCFGHYNGEEIESNWVIDFAAYYEATAETFVKKEYYIAVPSNSTHFRTNVKYGIYLPEDYFYCYLQKGIGIDKFVNNNIAENTDEMPKYNSAKNITSGALFDEVIRNDYIEITNALECDCAIKLDGNFGGTTTTKHLSIPVKPGEEFVIYAITTTIRYAFAKNNTYAVNMAIPLVDNTAVTVIERYDTVYVTIPDGCNYLLINLTNNGSNVWVKQNDIKVINPSVQYGTLRASNGEFDDNPDYVNMYEAATPRFIKVNDNFKIKTSSNVYVSVFSYDIDFNYIQSSGGITLIANTYVDITVAPKTEYVKLVFFNSGVTTDPTPVNIPVVTLLGKFSDDWDVYNVRPVDSGYHRIQTLVNVTNPTCCDSETSVVQDSCNYLVDYGLICLPSTYTNTGKPTRLIIYCHGAAVNYADNVTRFNSVDLEPDYWLAEGYAVMDMEGNPFDNTNEHICIPQAMDCYVAAYKWAIEHYNLRRDGVFIGGRSMGGYNTFNLIRRECPIPVIAACPNSPSSQSFGYSDKTRKEFCALHMGFVVPSGFVWSDGSLTAEEKQIILDNWDKYVKCVPYFNMFVDLPSKETLMDNYYGEARITLWSTLHMIAKCPIKLFGCNQDESCPPSATSALYYRALTNAGQLAELRLFNSYKDYTGTGTSAHHYDTQDPALRANVTTHYGEELTNIPIVYIEMLQFWRRYEQE